MGDSMIDQFYLEMDHIELATVHEEFIEAVCEQISRATKDEVDGDGTPETVTLDHLGSLVDRYIEAIARLKAFSKLETLPTAAFTDHYNSIKSIQKWLDDWGLA